jgi:hypothetical protein
MRRRYELEPARTFITEDVVIGWTQWSRMPTGIADAGRTLGMRAGNIVVVEVEPGRDSDGHAHVSTAAIG